ncbi:MAG TPA: hypothetical protein PK926_05740 [Spirochaetota bacterium]|nr:hypothetical protein [Spirochaetota bacterium]HPI87734.1 hypothetical protein [Spirochaetota bacterium]HPR48141.1 hypothetical protein [Spirochaetota bacterium]
MTPLKESALRLISDYVTNTIGEYFAPDILAEPNTISIHFIELLDQIAFEISQNKNREESINEYIIEDLFSRLNIFLDVYQGVDLYRKNLIKRNLHYEDTVIIRYFKIDEAVQRLLSDFNEHPDLQKDILRTLISFESDELLHFFYRTFKEEISIELKILALAGLKTMCTPFSNWSQLKKEFSDLKEIIDEIRSFNCADISKNKIPSNIDSCYFVSSYIESNAAALVKGGNTAWIFTFFSQILGLDEKSNFYYAEMCKSATYVILSIKPEIMKEALENMAVLTNFISIIDRLPLDQFNRIKSKISFIFNEYSPNIKKLFSSGSIVSDPNQSNTINFFFINPGNIF